jgi:murein tripeptide amidase MpaA
MSLADARAQTTRPTTFSAAAGEPVFPPLISWNGNSKSVAVAKDDPWVTPFEAGDFKVSPSYDDTVAWLRRLVDASPRTLKIVSLGKSPQGRDIWMVVASKDGNSTPDALKRSNKPTLLWQCGIHSGEIDGKDAGMMMLRDMTVRGTKRELLDGANLLFVPIFSVDGHERASKFNLSNQRGPEVQGWRTTSRNLNLNRDYAKVDSPEMRAMVRALDEWDPDLYFDIHVTDGADVQYDITWTATGEHGLSPEANRWIDRVMNARLDKDLAAAGHIPGRYLSFADPLDQRKGVVGGSYEPRYSNGYGDARHLPTVLVETHALKPYDQRVFGTYVMLESVMRLLGEQGGELRAATAGDRARRPKDVPLDWTKNDKPSHEMEILGIASRVAPSPISGGLRVEWLGKPVTMRVPFFPSDKVVARAARPKAYWVPSTWGDVIERLKVHGIKVEPIDAWREADVTMYRLTDPKFDAQPFEGRVRVTATPVAEKRREKFPPGSVRVPTDQPLGDLAVALLEPAGPDSFFQWGFFHEILQRTEYIDGYIMEPMAERMMQEDPKLREAFTKKLAEDKVFASDPAKRLDFFYERTPFYDERWRLYPVGRED